MGGPGKAGLLGLIEAEDVLLALAIVVGNHLGLALGRGETTAGAHALELLVYLPFLVCLAGRSDPGEPWRPRLKRGAAYLVLLSAYPVLRVLLRDRDRGEVVLGGVLLLGAGLALLFSLTRFAPAFSPPVRRWLLLPVTVLGTWYAEWSLVEHYFLGDEAVEVIGSGRPSRILDGLLALLLFMFVPWLALVAAPRIALGDDSGLRVWSARYGLFIAVSIAVFLVELP